MNHSGDSKPDADLILSRNNLEQLRLKINIINKDIARLLISRKTIAEQIGQEKRRMNIEVYDPRRESFIYEQLKKQSKPEDYAYLEPIFRQIILSSRQVQN